MNTASDAKEMDHLVERLTSHMGKADMGEVLRDCRLAAAEIGRLLEWKRSILGKCKHSDGWEATAWAGDKDGWGFVHYFIGHLETRALTAESRARDVRAEAIEECAQLALSNERHAEWPSIDRADIPVVRMQKAIGAAIRALTSKERE